MKLLMSILAAVILVFVYVSPAYVAFRRNHRRQVEIMLLDVFLGWTCAGWLAAALWALSGNVKNKRRGRLAPPRRRN